ncbi:MAG: DUF4286 family protein [Francisellaceae bacterium]|nr:DUF4286 family protein [Francisellaceae bacterium]MBT6208361.1 DUF4286 family protein [Francisellaceae bacterium]MBT6538575.1 DUF4286 family protein [Francisellaceae bacterium]
MVIYEVNLKVDYDIYENFQKWLNEHIKEMLVFPGFISATILQNTENSPNNDLCVQYKIESIIFLKKYFDNHAPKMRAEGLNMFENKFQATRRILNIIETIKF